MFHPASLPCVAGGKSRWNSHAINTSFLSSFLPPQVPDLRWSPGTMRYQRFSDLCFTVQSLTTHSPHSKLSQWSQTISRFCTAHIFVCGEWTCLHFEITPLFSKYDKHETLHGLKPSNLLNQKTSHIRIRVFWMQAIRSYADQISQPNPLQRLI